MPADQVRRLVGRRVWNEYYKFSIERNPWDAAVSFYFWRRARGETRSLNEFVQSDGLDVLARNVDIYSLRGDVAVDRLCRYETLTTDFAGIARQLRLPETLELPKAKSTIRTDRRHYSEVLDEKSRVVIAQKFQGVITELGYRFS